MEIASRVAGINLKAWESNMKQARVVIDLLTDAQLSREISPGRNRGLYILGHLTASLDRMFEALELGERLYPHLDGVFYQHPDKSDVEYPECQLLRQYWTTVTSTLEERIRLMDCTQLETDPVKLNILIGKTNHLAYHLGQLVLL